MKRIFKLLCAVTVLAALLVCHTSAADEVWTPESGTMDVKQIVAGKNNGGSSKYTNYRIPGIVVTKADTVIVYWEARMSGSDWADMDILAMRSEDGGETFGSPIIIAEGATAGRTMNNPVMIVGNDGTLHMLYCVEYGVCSECKQGATSACTHGPGVFYCFSRDDGLTWSRPENISNSTYSAEVEHYVIATGPGHGIALSDGTLIASVWMVEPQNLSGGITSHHAGSVSTLYSKDNGGTWNIGEIVPNDDSDGSKVTDPNETMLAETSDGRVMLTTRSGGGGYRALAWSPDGYSDWTTMEYSYELPDPTCMGSVVKYDIEGDPYTLLHINCEDRSSRSHLTLKGSIDDGKTWTERLVIEKGSAGYSDIAVDSKGTIYILYEVSYGVTCNLARLSYDCFIESSKPLVKKEIPKDWLILDFDGKAFADSAGLQPDADAVNVVLSNDGYVFNGTSSTLTVDGTEGLNAETGDFTYSVRFKQSLRTVPTEQQLIFWYGSVGTGAAQVWCRTNGANLQCNIASGGVETIMTAVNAVELGKWYTVTVVRRGTEHLLYINGVLAVKVTSEKVHNVFGNEVLTVGSDKASPTPKRYLNGVVGSIEYFNFALTDSEVKELYENGGLARLQRSECGKGSECPISEFSDVKADGEYHDGLHYVLESGIMNGVGDGLFAPERELSRAMTVTVLWRMAGSPKSDRSMSFGDVADGTWYSEAVAWAAAEGIVNGYSEAVFAPDDSVTREQLAAILFRYAKSAGVNVSSESVPESAEASDWAAEAVSWALANGLISKEGGKLMPRDNATRVITAVALYRLSLIG